MTRWLHRSFPLLWVLGPLALSAPAAAQDIAAAEALFNRGFADMEAKRYETGCKALAESQRIDPRPGTLFTLAFCESRWGRIATAVTRFGDYLSLVERMTPEQKTRQGERLKMATQERERLIPQMPELALSLPPGAPEGTVVKRDGQALGEASLGIALPIDPGDHVISTQAPGGPVSEQRITIAPGDKKQVTLEVKGSPAVPPAALAPSPPVRSAPPAASPLSTGVAEAPTGRRTAVYVAGGVGVAGLVVGGVLGALTLGKKSIVDEHCGSGIHSTDETACDATGLDATESASSLGLVSTIGFGVALAGIGAAAVLYWTEPKQANPPTSAATRWISAGVLTAGPTGAVLGAQGTW